MPVKVGMVSLGCSKNQVDAERMLYKLNKAGYKLVEDAALADITIVNTCGFIESAKQEAIDTILEFGKLKEEGQIKKIVITGCLAERYKEEVAELLPEADAVIGIPCFELLSLHFCVFFFAYHNDTTGSREYPAIFCRIIILLSIAVITFLPS